MHRVGVLARPVRNRRPVDPVQRFEERHLGPVHEIGPVDLPVVPGASRPRDLVVVRVQSPSSSTFVIVIVRCLSSALVSGFRFGLVPLALSSLPSFSPPRPCPQTGIGIVAEFLEVGEAVIVKVHPGVVDGLAEAGVLVLIRVRQGVGVGIQERNGVGPGPLQLLP